MQASEAYSLAIDACVVTFSPRSKASAARHVSSRAASMRIATSASRKPTAWCSTMGLPNCTRSRAYWAAYS